MLYSIREFGNTSSASIPTTICANYEKFKSENIIYIGINIYLINIIFLNIPL